MDHVWCVELFDMHKTCTRGSAISWFQDRKMALSTLEGWYGAKKRDGLITPELESYYNRCLYVLLDRDGSSPG